MKHIALGIVVFSAFAFAGTAFAQAPAQPESARMLAATEQSEIPPNCTLDPWTGRLTCHIWPTCTLDPWTGKMNCPVPRLAPLRTF